MSSKTIYQIARLFLVATIFAAIHSCQSPIMEEVETDSDLSFVLKSANLNKMSYIVRIQVPELDQELVSVKDYAKRNEKVHAAVAKILKRNGITDSEIGFVYSTAITGFSVKIPPGQFKKLAADGVIIHIEEDQLVTLSPIQISVKPGSTTPPLQTIPWGISRVGGGQSGVGKTAWIIDTGIDTDHPDLNVDVLRGANFSTDKTIDDLNGHGSHVAGTIAATNNSVGVIGVAAGATVIPVKVLNRRGSGTYSGVIAGIDFVAANGSPGDVANMSLGGSVSTTLDNAVIAAAATGIKFSLAAGNESDDANNHSPARANGPHVYTISAMNSSDIFAYFSNYGNPPVDFCAPGVSIYSTYKDGGYATLSGTSMAAPHVAGLLLLGTVNTDGTVSGDPDGNPDPIVHR
ncbi:S8 family peptidase [Gaoshiqia sp. Z1-71]|uniref:S8 family peptidase n=1 Tax=Gaoshiqia hydrogeniformans TaxID=3290090 RepID=UPI003BF84DDC